MVVDLAALTAEQACAADPFGNGFFPGPRERDAQHASLADITRPARGPTCSSARNRRIGSGTARTRASIPRLLWVIADGDQITQAHDASRQHTPGGSPDFLAPVDLNRAARTGAGGRATPRPEAARRDSRSPGLRRG
jgi:hypothetical protein